MAYKVNKSISAKENLYALVQYTWPEYADILNEDNVSLDVEDTDIPGILSVTISALVDSTKVTGSTIATYTVTDLAAIDKGGFEYNSEDPTESVVSFIDTLPCLPNEVVVGDLISTDGGWTISLSAAEGSLTVTGSTELSIVEEPETEGPGFGEHLILRSQGDVGLEAPIGSILHSIDGGETWNENTTDSFTITLPPEVETAVYLKSNDDVELTEALQFNNTTTNTDNFKGVHQWWESPRSIQLNVRDNSFYVPKVAPPNITDMSGMFRDASVFNSDISNWDVSNVTNMSGMFADAHAFNSVLSQWDVSKVEDISSMFSGAHAFNGDISNWDVSNVSYMSAMFSGASVFNRDISNWDVSNVSYMGAMFNGATSFNSDISQWDVSKVTEMGYMFYSAHAFNSDISQWDVSKVTNMIGMFSDARAFNRDITQWNVSKVTKMGLMFQEAHEFNQDLSNWCVSKITSMPNWFDSAATSWTLPRPVWGTCPGR